ncbi:MAG TPA: hypothetical protein VD905_18965 [Flavobacteriales bacterium]|nr:hypothetical protein [Flavobacteriales bacterium]
MKPALSLLVCFFSLALHAQDRGYPTFTVANGAKSVFIRNVMVNDTSIYIGFELQFDKYKNIVAEIFREGKDKKAGDSYYWTYDAKGNKIRENYYGIPHKYGNGIDTTVGWRRDYIYNEHDLLIVSIDSNKRTPHSSCTRIVYDSMFYYPEGIVQRKEHYEWTVNRAGAWEDIHETYTYEKRVDKGEVLYTSNEKKEQLIYKNNLLLKRIAIEHATRIEETYIYNNQKQKISYQRKTERGKDISSDTQTFNDKGYRIRRQHDYTFANEAPEEPDISEWVYFSDATGKTTKVEWRRTNSLDKNELREWYEFEWVK